MRAEKAPWPKTLAELNEYITSLKEKPHDYGTCVYAMSLSAVAAFGYVASALGVTGFQADCADLDFIRRTRNWKGPFIILNAENMLYPQYDLRNQLDEAMEGWKEWASKEAVKLLDQPEGAAHVREHWERLAAWKPKDTETTVAIKARDQ